MPLLIKIWSKKPGMSVKNEDTKMATRLALLKGSTAFGNANTSREDEAREAPPQTHACPLSLYPH
eukprot:10443306-Karenia_brevis.AAC.1